jgi:NTP pyrophosphatase (non-canonical NTP hydrolase)
MDELKIQKILRKFARDRDWEKFHSLKNLAISINIESSELLEIFQWEGENFNLLSDKITRKRVSEEIADIMLYLLRFSDLAKLDIEEICINKIKKNEKKYPANLSRGRSEKYDKLKEMNIIEEKKEKQRFEKLSKALRKNLLKRKEKKNGNNA